MDIPAAMTIRVADALKEIAPHFSDWVRQCAEAKIENERLREALRKITKVKPRYGAEADEMLEIAEAALKEKE